MRRADKVAVDMTQDVAEKAENLFGTPFVIYVANRVI